MSLIANYSASDFYNNLSPESKIVQMLLQPYKLSSSITLQNRLVMAPMTRCFAPNHEPTECMAEYYGKRGSFGMIISEATMVSEDATGYPDTPGIYTEKQILGWKRVSESIHAKGGKFFLQLWHAGVMSHPVYRNGKQPISASAVKPKKEAIPRTNGALKYDFPKEMDLSDMQEVKEAFLNAALNAIKAGCDGIELHAANGYLLDSFLHYYSNRRSDNYGQTPENMTRFLLEIIDQLIQAIGKDRIGVRLSPVPVPSMQNMEEDIRDQQVFIHLLTQLKSRGIAYIHASSDHDIQDCGTLGMPVSFFLKKHFGANVIGCGSYNLKTGAEAVNQKKFDLIAFGRLAIANPNLIEKLKNQEIDKLKSFEGLMLNTLD